MNISPKTRFQQDKEATQRHADLAATEATQRSLEVALCQMTLDLSSPVSALQASEFQYQLEGAKRFIRAWLSLSEPQKETIKTDSNHLNYDTDHRRS